MHRLSTGIILAVPPLIFALSCSMVPADQDEALIEAVRNKDLKESMSGPLILRIGINVPFWHPAAVAATARNLPASAVKFLYIGTPLLVLLIVDVWRLLNFLYRRKPDRT
jgi:hypothetical protein